MAKAKTGHSSLADDEGGGGGVGGGARQRGGGVRASGSLNIDIFVKVWEDHAVSTLHST